MRNYLAELLADLVDSDHLALALKLDEHLHQQWEKKASPDHKAIMAKFESNPSNDTSAELVLYVVLMEIMLREGSNVEELIGKSKEGE